MPVREAKGSKPSRFMGTALVKCSCFLGGQGSVESAEGGIGYRSILTGGSAQGQDLLQGAQQHGQAMDLN